MTPAVFLHPTSSDRHHFHLLDALRGLASILVLAWHAPSAFAVHNTNIYLAVDFFFCLSGFVIAFSYEKRLESHLSLNQFAAARAIRLYPMYLVGILLGVAPFFYLESHNNSVHNTPARLSLMILLQLLFIPNLKIWGSLELFPLNIAAWSTFVEMIANMGYAWMIKNRLARTHHILGIILLSFFLLAMFAQTHRTLDIGSFNQVINGLGFARIALSFGLGVMMLHVYRVMQQPPWTAVTHRLISFSVTVSLIVLLLAPFHWMRASPFLLLTITALFPMLVLLGAFCKLPPGWTAVCAWLGNISYPLYMLHVPILKILKVKSLQYLSLHHPKLSLACITLVILVISHLVFNYLDAPVRALLMRRYKERGLSTSLRIHKELERAF